MEYSRSQEEVLQEDDLDAPIIDANNDSGNWAVSYADLVTILLCFFIIFFNVDKFKAGVSILDKTRIVENPVATSDQPFVPAIIEDITKAFKASSDVSTQAKGEQVFVQFRNVVFFEKGSTSLTPEGERKVDEVYEAIKVHRPKLMVDIQGHADSSIVRPGVAHRRFSDNIELSSLRAISVFRYLSAKGIPPHQMSVSGYGDLSRPVLPSGTSLDMQDQLRRVTFLIKLKPEQK